MIAPSPSPQRSMSHTASAQIGIVGVFHLSLTCRQSGREFYAVVSIERFNSARNSAHTLHRSEAARVSSEWPLIAPLAIY